LYFTLILSGAPYKLFVIFLIFGCLKAIRMYTLANLTFRWPWIVINSYNKTQLDALISRIYFWNKTQHVSESSSAHHQDFFAVHTAMVYVIQVFWQLASRIRTDPARKQSANLYDIHHYCVHSEKLQMMDIGTLRNM